MSVSHSRTVFSTAAAMRWPSGLIATPFTPARVSMIRTVSANSTAAENCAPASTLGATDGAEGIP